MELVDHQVQTFSPDDRFEHFKTLNLPMVVDPLYVQGEINGVLAKILLDTGAGCSLISETTAKKRKLPLILWPENVPVMNMTTVTTPRARMGEFYTNVTVTLAEEKSFNVLAFEVAFQPGQQDLILGVNFLKENNVWVDCGSNKNFFEPPQAKYVSVVDFVSASPS